MATTHPEPAEPRIVKKKKAHHGAHGGAWKVAYADFVTAMMALFIVLWIMSQSQSIRQNVAQYFKNPGLLPGASGLMESSDMGGEMPTPGHSQELQTPSPLTPDLAIQEKAMEEVKKRIIEVIAQLPDLGRLKEQVLLEINNEGLRIELLDRENSHFFEVGSANLKPETKALLQHIAQELAKVPNQIIIEGHTDSRPYGTPNYTNWELSADRANAARRVMEAAHLRPGQIQSIKGYADQKLRNPEDPMDVQNRRVGIVVLFPDKSQAGSLKLDPTLENLIRPQKTPSDSPAGTPEPEKPAGSPGSAPPVKPTHPSEGKVQAQEEGPGGAVSGLLEDKVRQEIQDLMKLPRPGGSMPSETLRHSREPRGRLGW
uniref:OmpA-like domain-containing protein n=1 Tax=Desulfobacca acetoxidans TaxID=60893 RepID=A0A7C5ALI1_9BACT